MANEVSRATILSEHLLRTNSCKILDTHTRRAYGGCHFSKAVVAEVSSPKRAFSLEEESWLI